MAREISSSKPGILVVDDDDGIRGMVAFYLDRHGYTVWQAANGQEAVEVYQQHRDAIAVVLLDVRMPGLDGPQALQALRVINPEIRCCFMTGESGPYTLEELYRLGAIRVFRKPFASLPELVQVLGELVQGKIDPCT